MKRQELNTSLRKRTLYLLLIFVFTFSVITGCSSKEESENDNKETANSENATQEIEKTKSPDQTENNERKETVTILYTNDIHAYLNNDNNEEEPGISYAQLSQLKKDLGENTILVDAGDHIQGSVYGAMDEGNSVVEIMNNMYDLATLGNHEFDYGIDRTLSITNNSKYPYICCNFVHKDNEKPVLKPHKIFEVGGLKVGFVGITTPETLTSTAPAYFQNDKGEFIYDFLDNDKLYGAVQSSVDTLKNEGADYIIALGHVGVDKMSETTSREIIENVSGLDAFIDGHSHTEIETEIVKDKEGKEVVLTQTGYYFGGIGKMTISGEDIKTEIVKEYDKKDEIVLNEKDDWVSEVDQMLGEKIATLESILTVNDAEGNRLIRVDGTNLGEFVADAYYYYVNFVSEIDCDVAIINGGGVRADINAGEVSYKDLKSANPFGNMICAVELKGQQILDMLEWGARATTGVAGECEEGSILHTAGLIYTIDASIISSVGKNDQNIWTGAPTGEYRVKDVKIYDKKAEEYVDLDLTKTYCVAGANYTLTNKGGGFEMIEGKTIKDYIVEDYMALAVYAVAFDDVDGDDLSDIATKNSPLKEYENYGMDYEKIEGANRLNVSTN